VARDPGPLLVCLALILLACGARFVALDMAPPGFFFDEAGIAAQVICVRNTGFDWWAGTIRSSRRRSTGPTSMYPAAAWTALFGDGIAAFRSLAALSGLVTVAGVGVLLLRLRSVLDLLGLTALGGLTAAKRLQRDAIGPISAAILPAALTWEGNPHALRSNTSLVFVSGVTGFFLAEACKRWKWMIHGVVVVAAISAAFYARFFFTDYPLRAANSFDVGAVGLIEQRLHESPRLLCPVR
jgi:hypothetical protein